MIAATDACQATVTASWRLVNPKVFSNPRSRRRRRTEAVSVMARAPTAPAASAAAKMAGVSPVDW
jgi:hypothetical protein